MDGLRGLVAVLVFVRHFTLPWFAHIDYGYGCQDTYYGVLRLPFLRLLYSGPLVPVFFVVSGYVLSAKTIRLSHRSSSSSTCGNEAQAFVSLSASAFRRALRLFPPPIASTFLVMLLVHAGFFSFNYDAMPGRQPVHPEALSSFAAQLGQWGLTFVADELANPWRWDVPRLIYGPHLWTIPVSFKGSAVTFLACLMLARARPNVRLGLLCAAVAYALSRGRWDMAPFLGGIVLCELDAWRDQHHPDGKHGNNASSESKKGAKHHPRHLLRKLHALIPTIALLAGLYVGSFPRANNAGEYCVVGYQTLCRITPSYRYWHAAAAFTTMWALSRSTTLQRPFVSGPARYLGRVSFSMYLVHEPLLHVFGFFTVPFFWGLTGDDRTGLRYQYQLGFGLGMALTAFVLVWVADLFREYVELPCGRVAARVESLCLVRVVGGEGPGMGAGTGPPLLATTAAALRG